MTPHMSKEDRKKTVDTYKRIVDGEEEVTSAIIERDRDRLRKLLSSSIWQMKAQK